MIITLETFEMRNTVIVSRGRGGVKGGLEGAKYSRGKEEKKEENRYEGDAC